MGPFTSTRTDRDLSDSRVQHGDAGMRDETMRRSLHSPSDAVLQLALNVSTPDEYDAEKVERLRVHQAAARHGEETPLFKDEIDRDLLSDIAGHWIGAPANARRQRLAARTRSATASKQSPPLCTWRSDCRVLLPQRAQGRDDSDAGRRHLHHPPQQGNAHAAGGISRSAGGM